jgi:hypothetical protein
MQSFSDFFGQVGLRVRTIRSNAGGGGSGASDGKKRDGSS